MKARPFSHPSSPPPAHAVGRPFPHLVPAHLPEFGCLLLHPLVKPSPPLLSTVVRGVISLE
ncbi:hypothetical protein HMPREF3036_00061 [Sutterella sp. KLE1602]|nr:hypothetical protein HMPREF3036_00061 [Sutterella sp. KLE1602]